MPTGADSIIESTPALLHETEQATIFQRLRWPVAEATQGMVTLSSL